MEERTYSLKMYKGIDDLESEYAFVGNSQGDESRSNLISDYESSKGWMSFIFDCELTQEAINKEVELRKERNKRYIEELKITGEYKQEYETKITVAHNPLYDEPDIRTGFPLESYRIEFINPKSKD